jgi:hypothetical protein
MKVFTPMLGMAVIAVATQTLAQKPSVGGLIFIHVFLCFFLAVGLSCIFVPRWVQARALRWNRDWMPGIPNPLIGWMRTDGYRIFLRIMGVLCLVVVSIFEIRS